MGGREALDPGDRRLAPTVSNASPLIALSPIGRLHLFHALFGEIVVPTAVVRETPRVPKPSWMIERSPGPLPRNLLAASLGPGATDAVALALAICVARVVLDERRATRIARSLRLSVVGTLGVLLLAKTQGHRPTVRPAITDLLAADFHLSTRVIDDTLQLADETR